MVINLGDYQLEVIYCNDDFIDTKIIYQSQVIGVLDLRISDYVFIRQIRIEANHRNCGHARHVVDALLATYKKDIKLCIAENSESAVGFWHNYFKRKEQVEHIRGAIYKINYIS